VAEVIEYNNFILFYFILFYFKESRLMKILINVVVITLLLSGCAPEIGSEE
jgi:hypothetical protein